MKTKTITLYEASELSETALQSAHAEYCGFSDYPWSKDNQDSLEAFQNLFPVVATDWEYGYHNFINYRHNIEDAVLSLRGVRLMKYIVNNYISFLSRPKVFELNGKKRKSKVLFWGPDSYCLTGYWIDYELMDPIFEFIKNPNDHQSLEDILSDSLWAWVYACRDDWEGYYSMDSFIETAEANEWFFDENGKFQ